MNKLIIIVFLLLLVSCNSQYIYENPNHPVKYLGNWICDSTFVKNARTYSVERKNFTIMQTGVDITINDHYLEHYSDWKMDNSKTIPSLILYDANYIEQLFYDVVVPVEMGVLGLKLDTVTYYLSK
jgi:hypothetical protein